MGAHPGQRRGAKGTSLGGKFVGPKSVARFLVKEAEHAHGSEPDLRSWTTEQLTDEFARLSHTLSGHELETALHRVDAELASRRGESRAQTIRRLHFEQVAVAVLQAEDDTNGNLLNPAGKAAGIDPATLWSGPAARARKYASDELKQWWSEHGGRMTAAEFAAQHTGDNPAAIGRARLAGQGRDYGV